MLKKKFKYLTLIIFLFSVLMIVFLQFNSGQSINKLIDSNMRLLNELKTQRDLQILEKEIISVESNVRGAVITENTAHLKNLEEGIQNINLGLKKLDIYFHDPVTDSLLQKLNTVVENKIEQSTKIIRQYQLYGKDSAEYYINQGQERALTDSIVLLIDVLTSTRQAFVKTITENITDNGNKARSRGMFLAIVAAISSIFAFFYIIITSRRQQRLIAYLNESENKERESSRIKEKFLSNMSHEIRTPLNAILGFTHLLEKTRLSPIQKEYIDYMHSSGNNLLTVVNDILDLSKIEAGMMRIENTSFDIYKLVESIKTMFSEKSLKNGLLFEVMLDENIPRYLMGDSFRLTQILNNLIGNAIKFTEKGSVKLIIREHKKLPERMILQFEIIDTGIGIEQEKLDAIFDRFQQAEMETTRKYGGTGLGLSIVKELVLLKNGHIEVNSDQGTGTSFKVFLPFGLMDKQKNAEKSQEKFPSNINNQKAHILVAEDNLINQQLVKHLLTHHNFSFVIVSNGNEVIEKLKNETFDLVLMDIQMPEKNGYETTGIIRSQLNEDIPVVAMTAYSFPGEKEKCLAAGINDYIAKPINESDLIDVIHRNLEAGHPAKKNVRQDKLIDTDYLFELSGENASFKEKLLTQFEIQLPQELDELEEAIQQNDKVRIHSIVHSLKSTLGYVGVNGGNINSLLAEIDNEKADRNEQSKISFSKFRILCMQALKEIR